jgi:hypothetical protein
LLTMKAPEPARTHRRESLEAFAIMWLSLHLLHHASCANDRSQYAHVSSAAAKIGL